jgi:hypothetical protein
MLPEAFMGESLAFCIASLPPCCLKAPQRHLVLLGGSPRYPWFGNDVALPNIESARRSMASQYQLADQHFGRIGILIQELSSYKTISATNLDSRFDIKDLSLEPTIACVMHFLSISTHRRFSGALGSQTSCHRRCPSPNLTLVLGSRNILEAILILSLGIKPVPSERRIRPTRCVHESVVDEPL